MGAFHFNTGNILPSPSAITSTARAARIRPMSRVITLMPVLPSTRAIGSASEKHTAVASGNHHAVAHQCGVLPEGLCAVGVDHHGGHGGRAGEQRDGQRHHGNAGARSGLLDAFLQVVVLALASAGWALSMFMALMSSSMPPPT
jgi:hypothetical protein